jgi:hypothetical protein
LQVKAKALKKKVKQGKAAKVYVKIKPPKHTAGKRHDEPDMGVLVTLPANTTLVGFSKMKATRGIKNKGMKGIIPINATTVAWRPKKRGKRKLHLLVRVRVDSAYPYSVLPIDFAGFTGELCVGGQATVAVPVVPSDHHGSSTKEQVPNSGKV